MSFLPPIPYDPAVETPAPDEGKTFESIIASLGTIQETTFKDYGHAVRGVHAKPHGFLFGTLEVLAGTDPSVAQGLFAQPGWHEVVLRLSTNPGDILDDSVSTPRGLGVKILGVSGDFVPEAVGGTQDFVLANAPAFFAPNAKAFAPGLKLLAATTDTPQIFKKALSAILRGAESVVEALGGKSPTLVALGGHPETHILGETFFSAVPIRWGDYVAKVAVAPVSENLRALTGAALNVNGKPNGLREAVIAFFAENDAAWELRVQLRRNEATMPVEDASVVWPEDESPYIPVARIAVPRQEAWTEVKAGRVNDELAFSPWNALSAHRPLGSIMRVRRATYPVSAGFRAEHNGCPIRHPGSIAELGG
jgi:hypothetical protein